MGIALIWPFIDDICDANTALRRERERERERELLKNTKVIAMHAHYHGENAWLWILCTWYFFNSLIFPKLAEWISTIYTSNYTSFMLLRCLEIKSSELYVQKGIGWGRETDNATSTIANEHDNATSTIANEHIKAICTVVQTLTDNAFIWPAYQYSYIWSKSPLYSPLTLLSN